MHLKNSNCYCILTFYFRICQSILNCWKIKCNNLIRLNVIWWFFFLITKMYFFSIPFFSLLESWAVSKRFIFLVLYYQKLLFVMYRLLLRRRSKLHRLSVTNFSLSCLLCIVCGTCSSSVLGYFFWFSVCTADFHPRYHCGCCTVWHSCCLVVIVIFLSVCSYSGELV